MVALFPHNPEWKSQFEEEACQLKHALGTHVLELHHFGSTAIPDLVSKKDLDILCIIDHLEASLNLEKIGYTFKGEYNVPLRYFFSKNNAVSKVNLHVVEEGHGFIALNLCFRDYLRQHPQVRDAYGALKHHLAQIPEYHERSPQGFKRYTLEKDAFIKKVLSQANFQGITVNFSLHDTEWTAYEALGGHRSKDPTHFHFVLYQGPRIIGVAQLRATTPSAYDLSFVKVSDESWQHPFQGFLKKWARHKGAHLAV